MFREMLFLYVSSFLTWNARLCYLVTKELWFPYWFSSMECHFKIYLILISLALHLPTYDSWKTERDCDWFLPLLLWTTSSLWDSLVDLARSHQKITFKLILRVKCTEKTVIHLKNGVIWPFSFWQVVSEVS